jgi:cation diffusion facilitator CzcD-associated flavoprotein CzcO
VRKTDGKVFEHACDFLINAAGILNAWKLPDITGLDSFKGTLVHTARWNEAIDVAGKTVGLVGNGYVPRVIAEIVLTSPDPLESRFSPSCRGTLSDHEAGISNSFRTAQHVTAFLRGPTWVSPARGMEYHIYTEEERKRFQDTPTELLAMRKQTESFMTSATLFSLFIKGSKAQEVLAQDMEDHMRMKIDNDLLAQALIPEYPLGCRRPTVGYLTYFF